MKTEITIKGTHCASCKALIEDVCKDVAGVSGCTVDYESGKTIVEHDEQLDWSTLTREISGLGEYSVICNEKIL